jgi:hypothetical protein
MRYPYVVCVALCASTSFDRRRLSRQEGALIADIYERALEAVARDSAGDLRMGLRRRLMSELSGIDGSRDPVVGHRRRVTVAIKAIEKVLPMWSAAFPTEQSPREALDVAQGFLDGRRSEKETEHAHSVWWSLSEDLHERVDGDPVEISVGYGAALTALAAGWDGVFGLDEISEDATDEDVDAFDHDPMFWAAATYANGATWEQRSDVALRRAFWQWWLTECVLPEASNGRAS